MIVVATDNVWQFGECEFDEREGRLAIAGRAVELDRACRAILLTLLRHAGEEVGKEHLLRAGWPNRIVHENSLAKAIGRLRQAIGDRGDLLETVYGHGYRLKVEVGAVVAGPSAAPPEPVPGTGTAPSSRQRRRSVWPLAAAVLVLGWIGGALILNLPAKQDDASYRTTPPATADAPDVIGRVLWVDDHPQNNVYEKRFFEDHRIAVHNVAGSVDALRLLAMYDYDIVISDMGRGEDRLAGIRLVEQMRARGEETPLLIYTLRPDGAEAQQAQRELVAEAGAQGVVVTPQEVRSVVLKLFGNPEARPSS